MPTDSSTSLDGGLPRRPRVSFVVATHNRGPVVVECLRRTLHCGLSATQFDVIVVDNASTDGTAVLIESLAAEFPVRLIRLAKNRGPVAKNYGLHKNPADILVLLDDDAYPLPGAVPQMVRHFQDDPHLGAAVFDVTLPDGAKEASAFPCAFIGAGTAIRGAALRGLAKDGGGRGGPLLPADFFMQAEEYDLSFRLLEAGFTIQRFWDMPLLHLKTPNARIGHRTTRLDIRNNLYLLAKYLPEPLCYQFAADWLDRYWRMAVQRDQGGAAHKKAPTHKKAFLMGAAEGLHRWKTQREGGRLVLSTETLEKIFRFGAIREKLAIAQREIGLRRVAFADFGKNMLAFHRAAEELGVGVVAVVDNTLAGEGCGFQAYRGVPVVDEPTFRGTLSREPVDALILTALSPVHAQRRAAALRRVFQVPVIDLFAKRQIIAAS